MRRVKELALRENRQMSEVVNQLLLEGLARRENPPKKMVELKSFRMGEARINLGDRDALEAAMTS